ncbi:MAG: hypothetical protein ACREJ4_05590 [Candidatus Methylomirabilaceae bacterium]
MSVVLITERSDQARQGTDDFTIYRGAWRQTVPPWKLNLWAVTNTGRGLPAEFSDSIVHSIGNLFAEVLSRIHGIERIFVRRDDDFLRLWAVIPRMNLTLEDQIYDAQLAFMSRFPEVAFDFTVIFREGKDPASIRPHGARLV